MEDKMTIKKRIKWSVIQVAIAASVIGLMGLRTWNDSNIYYFAIALGGIFAIGLVIFTMISGRLWWVEAKNKE